MDYQLENILDEIQAGTYTDLEDLLADYHYEVERYAESDLGMGKEDDFVLSDKEILEQAQNNLHCPYIDLTNHYDVELLQELNRLKFKFSNHYKLLDILEKL